MCVNSNNFSLYSWEKPTTIVSYVLTINMHLPALYCTPAHQEGLFNGTNSNNRYHGLGDLNMTNKQNKLPSFIDRFNPWNVKFELWFIQGRVGTRRVCWIGYEGGTLAT
jgi:hypothetical protein